MDTGMAVGRVLCSLSAVRLLQASNVDVDAVIVKHRAGLLPNQQTASGRVSHFRFRDRDGIVVEAVVTTRRTKDKPAETVVSLPWD
jgi:hypothetical protein